MASFQAKMSWEMLRKIKINKVVPMSTFLGWGWMTRGEKKIIVPFLSYPTRNRKFQKNS